MTFIPLKPEIAQKLLEQVIDSSETQQWAGEVAIFSEQKKKQKYILLTESCLYFFSKARMRNQYDREIVLSIFDLVSCELVKAQEELKLTFRGTEEENTVYDLFFPESGQLLINLYRQYKYLTWNVCAEDVPGIIVINNAKNQKQPDERPKHILLHRYISSCISKSTEMDPQIIEIIKKYDEAPSKTIKLSDISMKSQTPLFFSLSLEADLKTIILERFSPDNLGTVFSWILANYNSLTTLILEGYETANFKGINIKRNQFNHLKSIKFSKCSAEFISKFLIGTKQLTYGIETLIFEDISNEISEELMNEIRQCIENTTFLSNISTLGFLKIKSKVSLIDFVNELLKNSNILLKQLIIEDCQIDVCKFMSMLCSVSNNIHRVSLRKNYGKELMAREVYLPEKLIHLSVSESKFSGKSLSSFLFSLCRRSRKEPLTLDLDKIDLSVPWSELFGELPLDGFHPVITELNMSDNILNSKSFDEFLNFLNTQSQLNSESQYKLMYLDISGCLKEDIESSFSKLASFFSARELWGLALCKTCTSASNNIMDSIVDHLIEIRGLTVLNISSNYMQDSTTTKFLHFVRESKTIAEICVDNCEIQDPEQMLWFYECLVLSPHILSFNPIIKDLEPVSQYNEAKRIKDRLLRKRPFSTCHQRQSLYLSLYGDFETRIINPISQNDLITDPLFETTFRNPVPSLFTLASLSTIDTSVDPLASMVTEYIATSGKCGIVPPTAPPPEKPEKLFELPSIFASMQMYVEDEPSLALNKSNKMNDISKNLAKMLNPEHEKISIFSVQNKKNYHKLTTLPLIDFGNSS